MKNVPPCFLDKSDLHAVLTGPWTSWMISLVQKALKLDSMTSLSSPALRWLITESSSFSSRLCLTIPTMMVFSPPVHCLIALNIKVLLRSPLWALTLQCYEGQSEGKAWCPQWRGCAGTACSWPAPPRWSSPESGLISRDGCPVQILSSMETFSNMAKCLLDAVENPLSLLRCHTLCLIRLHHVAKLELSRLF